MVLNWLADGQPSPPPDEAGWAAGIAPGQVERWVRALDAMPLALTIATSVGPVGIVHAESPDPVWANALELFGDGDIDTTSVALLDFAAPPAECERRRRQPVQRLQAAVNGHTILRSVRSVANRWYIDTGAGARHANRLTVMEIGAARPRWWAFDAREAVAG